MRTLVNYQNLSLEVIADPQHEFLMETTLVAQQYGVSNRAINQHCTRNADEFVEGKHWFKGANKLFAPLETKNQQPNQIYWTKKGIVRLGFFIRSEKAKLFRDWAEDLILNVLSNKQVSNSPSDTVLILLNNLSNQMSSLAATQNHLLNTQSQMLGVAKILNREINPLQMLKESKVKKPKVAKEIPASKDLNYGYVESLLSLNYVDLLENNLDLFFNYLSKGNMNSKITKFAQAMQSDSDLQEAVVVLINKKLSVEVNRYFDSLFCPAGVFTVCEVKKSVIFKGFINLTQHENTNKVYTILRESLILYFLQHAKLVRLQTTQSLFPYYGSSIKIKEVLVAN